MKLKQHHNLTSTTIDVLRTMINKKTPSPFIVFKTICDLKPLCAAQQLNVTLTKQLSGKYFFFKNTHCSLQEL